MPAEICSSARTAESAPDIVAPPGGGMRRRLRSSAFWTLFGRASAMGSLVVTNLIIGRLLGKETYSAYFLALTVVPLVAMIVTFGMPQILVRGIRELDARGAQRMFPALFAASLKTAALAAVVVAPVLYFAAQYLPQHVKYDALRNHAGLVVVWALASSGALLAADALRGIDDFRGSALVGARNGGAAAALLFLTMLGIAVGTAGLSLPIALWLQLAAVSATAVAGVAYAWRKLQVRAAAPRTATISAKPDAGELADATNEDIETRTDRWLVRESVPNLGLQLTTFGLVQIDAFLVSWFLTDAQLGEYGAVSVLGKTLIFGQQFITAAAAPFVAELYAKRNLVQLERLVRGSASVVAAPVAVLLLIFLVAAEWIIGVTYGDSYVAASWPLRIAVIGCFASIYAGNNGMTLIMTGNHAQVLKITLFTMAVYVTLMPFAARAWGLLGVTIVGTAVGIASNLALTFAAKHSVGVWTHASLRPAVLRDSLQSIFRR